MDVPSQSSRTASGANWDDLRVFLALARTGSVRAAARDLQVTHPTVSRRLAQLETRLGTRLFERLPTGYTLTPTGDEILALAVAMEEQVQEVGRRVLGRDAELRGPLRVTLPAVLADHLFMPSLKEFADRYPGVELEIETSYGFADLSRREADVAIRTTRSPPEMLFGRKLNRYANAIYASLDYLAEHDPVNDPLGCRWLGWGDEVPRPAWVAESPFPDVPVWGCINNPLSQLEAAKAGLGIAMLGCMLGDSEPTLRRLPPGVPTSTMDVWILTHPDLRQTHRVRAFMEFAADALLQHRDLVEGRRPGFEVWQPPAGR